MRGAGSWPPGRLPRVLEFVIGDVSLGRDCAVWIELPEDDGEIVDDRLNRRQPIRWVLEPRRKTSQRLSQRPLCGLKTFGVIAVQQRDVGTVLQHERQLPREIVGIVNAGVAAESAGRRNGVGGVANQEYAPFAEPVRDRGDDIPVSSVEESDGDIQTARGLA